MSWDPEVRTTDACNSGWGACTCTLGSDWARTHGIWNERWRYRRLTPDEWAPRKRALFNDSTLDKISDPRVVGD
eukprot:5841154-Karenia_brevis.AAC.1